jgi:hypothetical protein
MTNPLFTPPNLPENNWVRKYFSHKCELVPQCYPEYHFAATLGKLQMATGRRAYIRVSGRVHYSNLNHMCLGAPATSNKTDALAPFREQLFSLFPDKDLPSDFSGAGLLEELQEKPTGFLVSDEAGTLLNRIHNNKEAGIIRDTLCKVYDNDPKISKKLRSRGKDDGRITIVEPFPLIVLGTTPETFSQYSSGLDMTSGWFPRFLFYNPSHEKPFIPMDFDYDPTDHDRELDNELNRIANILKELPGMKFAPDADAKQIFDTWHELNEKKYRTSSMQATIFRRLMVMALKLAMNFMIGDIHNDGKLTRIGNRFMITPEYLNPAIALVDNYFLPHAISVFEMVERDASKNIQDKIISILKRSGGEIEQWRLSKDLHIKANDRDEHLHALQESHEVTLIQRGKTVWVRFYQDGDDERIAEAVANDARREAAAKQVKNALKYGHVGELEDF